MSVTQEHTECVACIGFHAHHHTGSFSQSFEACSTRLHFIGRKRKASSHNPPDSTHSTFTHSAKEAAALPLHLLGLGQRGPPNLGERARTTHSVRRTMSEKAPLLPLEPRPSPTGPRAQVINRWSRSWTCTLTAGLPFLQPAPRRPLVLQLTPGLLTCCSFSLMNNCPEQLHFRKLPYFSLAL